MGGVASGLQRRALTRTTTRRGNTSSVQGVVGSRKVAGRCSRGDSTGDDDEVVKEFVAEDGRRVLYSVNPDDETPADTEEWIASDTTVSGSDQQ